MKISEAIEYLKDYEGDRMAIEPEFGELIYDLIVEGKPDVIVEVGTGKGYSTSWMILALEKIRKARLFTIDIQRAPDLYLWNKMNLPTGRLEILPGKLKENLQYLPDKIGLAFLDADHQIGSVVDDVELLSSRIVPGGKLVIHDVNYCREMGNLLRDYFGMANAKGLKHCGVVLPDDCDWEFYEEIARYSGLGIVTKKGETK